MLIHLQIFSPPECLPHEGRDLVCLVLCSIACPAHSVLPVRVVQQILVKGMSKGNFPRVENMTLIKHIVSMCQIFTSLI